MLIEALQNSIENKLLRRSCFKSHPSCQGAAGAMWRPDLSWLRSAGTTMQNPSKCSVWEAEGAVCHPRTESRAHLSLQSMWECLPKVFSWQITEHFYTKTQIFQYKIYIFFPMLPSLILMTFIKAFSAKGTLETRMMTTFIMVTH